jgi:pyruvate,water dikinase
MIHWFGQTSPQSTSLGGKGAGLDRLARLGFPIPPGFCLATTAYERYFDLHGLDARVTELSHRLPDESARQELAGLAHSYPLPSEVADLLRQGIETLTQRSEAPTTLAVRSSSVGEDARAASFAGAHETILGVPGDRIEGAVRSCWASLWSARAVAYRIRKRLGFDNPAMAVVVQTLVPAEVSAVVFTRNPVSGKDDEILINATWGLGETIVSGAVTPDTVVLNKATLRVRHIENGDKTLQVIPNDSGGTTTVPTTKEGLALDQHALDTLGQLCRSVEQAFGEPIDIEAAFAHGQWYLLQARPITTGGSRT